MWSTTVCTCRSIRKRLASNGKSCSENAASAGCVGYGCVRALHGARAGPVLASPIPAREEGLRGHQELGLQSHEHPDEVLGGGVSQISAERLVRGLAEGDRVRAVRLARERGRPRLERP